MKKSCIFLFALGLMTGCVSVPQETHTSFETITISQQTVTAPSRWSAVIRGKKDVNVCPRVGGNITEIYVVEGQAVKAGQLLFCIDDAHQRIALQHAKANLQAAQASEKNAAIEYESHQRLRERGIISEYLLRSAENNWHTAEAQVAQARAQVADAEVGMGHCRITSPVDGVVGDLPYHIGDQVAAGTVMTTVAGNEEMQVTFSLTETQVRGVVEEVGSLEKAIPYLPELTLLFKDGKEYDEKGKVTSFSGLVDQRTGAVTCYATFPNPKGVLFSGMQGTIVMPFEYPNAIVIPLSAIVRLQDKTMVYRVEKDSTATSVLVEIEELGDGKNAVLLNGITPGEQIIAKGAANVHDGQQVIY